jgi:hypothetical protein
MKPVSPPAMLPALLIVSAVGSNVPCVSHYKWFISVA